MSLLEGFETMHLVKTDPNWKKRLEHHEAVVAQLRHFRETLEQDMEPEPWTTIETPMVMVLSDVCKALELTEQECATVLGDEGITALHRELAIRPMLLAGEFNQRQITALACVRKHGEITLSTLRAIFPCWSDETLRLDLAGLVKRGLLVKNGVKKGTRYVLPEIDRGGLANTRPPDGGSDVPRQEAESPGAL